MPNIETVRRFIDSLNKCVDYVDRATRCPVCEFLNIAHLNTRVTSTRGEGVRYMYCEACTCSFKAVEHKKPIQEQFVPESKKTKKKNKKSRRK